MTSGIYQLTYVGQSINIEERWKQHKKNMASKSMRGFRGSFEAIILLEVHPDWLDYYEAYFINKFRPELNATIPKLRISEYDLEYMVDRGWNLKSLSMC